jgi:hypothetical protein
MAGEGMAASGTRVLFIGGEGRSGSTVLERLIASYPQTCSVGELKNLFERGVGHGEICGCGSPVPDCELWSEVGRRLVGGWDTSAGRELVEFFTRVNHRLRLPLILTGRSAMVARARSVLGVLYPMVADLSGSSVIVDSSKHPAWAYLLAGTPQIDLRVVHLVRHPSGVANSWSRPVGRPHAGEGSGDQLMPAHSPLEVSIRWDVFNELFHHLARQVPTVVVRYEDYVEDTDAALRACLGLADLAFDSRPVTLSTGHGIAGNPSRFTANVAKVTPDDQWVAQLGASRHLMVSAITWPMRSAYGYRFDRSAPVGPYRGRRVAGSSGPPRPPG